MNIKQFYPYSPRKADFAQLSESFVAREHLLEELITSIKDQADAKALQHWMILGMRGMGKSHLISLTYQTVKNSTNINQRWVPLLMHEEEQSVFSLHTLFIRFLIQLGEELADADKKRSEAVFEFLEKLRNENKNQEEILESVVAYLKDFVVETQKKILVFIENSDDIFSRYISKKNDIKKLRNILQHDNFMLLIATSPTFFDGISKPNAPLYQFFRIRNLELLSYEQAVELLNLWKKSDTQDSDKKKPSIQFEKQDYKLRALYHLTGGNPRVLLFLYMAIKGQNGILSAVKTFSKLLEEDLSIYYLSRLRDLSNQVQPIILALAESDTNLTQKEISQKTFLPMRSIGTAMLRLEKDNLVKPVTEKKGKNTLYTLTDHLFRLWHQWRISAHNKEIIKAVVMCVAVWYKKNELEQWSTNDDITGKHCKEALQYRTTDHFKSLWAPLHNKSGEMVISHLKKEDYKGFDKTLAMLEETGIEPKILLGNVARYLEDSGDVKNALKAMEKRLENNDEDREALVNLSRLNVNLKNYPGAEEALEKAIALDKENTTDWNRLGLIRTVQGNYASAEEAFENAIILDKVNATAWEWLGRTHSTQENYTAAEQAFENAIPLDPENSEVWKFLGHARSHQSDYSGAKEALEKAVMLDPENIEAWEWLGLTHSAQENYTAAEQAFEKAVALNPKNAETWKELGFARGDQGNYVGAEEAFKKAVSLEQKNVEAWEWLGRAYAEQGNFAEAKKALEKVVTFDKENTKALEMIGIIQIIQGNYTKAEEAFEKAIKLDTESFSAWEFLGDIRYNKNNYAGAEIAFNKLITLKPFKKEIHGKLLKVFVGDNRVPDILPVLENALSLSDGEDDFKAFIHFIRGFVFLYQQDRTPFLKEICDGASHLKDLTEEKKHEVLGTITGFLSDTLREKNIHVHRIYVAEIIKISTELSGVFKPVNHVLDYFEAIFSTEKNKKAKTDKAQRILDSITSEIRGPVEKMINKIKKSGKYI